MTVGEYVYYDTTYDTCCNDDDDDDEGDEDNEQTTNCRKGTGLSFSSLCLVAVVVFCLIRSFDLCVAFVLSLAVHLPALAISGRRLPTLNSFSRSESSNNSNSNEQRPAANHLHFR